MAVFCWHECTQDDSLLGMGDETKMCGKGLNAACAHVSSDAIHPIIQPWRDKNRGKVTTIATKRTTASRNPIIPTLTCVCVCISMDASSWVPS